MYTRFKSQNCGIKHGLTQITQRIHVVSPTNPTKNNNTILDTSSDSDVNQASQFTFKSSIIRSSKLKSFKNEAILDEYLDQNCVYYVKSLWEQYQCEIGTQNGPLRYEDEDKSRYTHLNDFVPLDIESWWGERLLSKLGLKTH